MSDQSFSNKPVEPSPTTLSDVAMELRNLKSRLTLHNLIVSILLPLIIAGVTAWTSHCSLQKQSELNKQFQQSLNEEQSKLNNNLDKKLADFKASLTEYQESQKYAQQTKWAYYNEVKNTLTEVDDAFAELATVEYKKKFPELDDALYKLYRHTRNTPSKMDSNLLEALEKYNKFIVNKVLEFDELSKTNKLDPVSSKQVYDESKILYSNAKTALDSYINSVNRPK